MYKVSFLVSRFQLEAGNTVEKNTMRKAKNGKILSS